MRRLSTSTAPPADEERPAPGAAVVGQAGPTVGTCRKCKAPTGEFFNHFQRVSGTYYLPALVGSYSHCLKPIGKRSPASAGTELDGCLIQPLVCPGCPTTLGFHVIDAPQDKEEYKDRTFFKLPRIDLHLKERSGPIVEPYVGRSGSILSSTRSTKEASAPPLPAEMDVAIARHEPQHREHPFQQSHQVSHLESHRHSLPPMRSPNPSNEHHIRQSLQPTEPTRQSLPPIRQPENSQMPSNGVAQKAASSHSSQSESPAVRPVHDVQFAQPSPRESPSMAHRARELPPVMGSPRHLPSNGHESPGSLQALQAQTAHNTAALDILRRNFDTFRNDAVAQEQALRNSIKALMEEVRYLRDERSRLNDEVVAARTQYTKLHLELFNQQKPPPPPPIEALTLMGKRLDMFAQTVGDVESFKTKLAIQGEHIRQLAEGKSTAPPQQSIVQQPMVHQPLHNYQNTPPAGPPRSIPPTVHSNAPAFLEHRPSSNPPTEPSASTPKLDHYERAEPVQPHSGWATVNSTKRPHGYESPPNTQHPSKRQNLGDSRMYHSSQLASQHSEYVPSEETESRLQTQSTFSNSASNPYSLEELNRPAQPTGYPVPYSTQDAPSDDSWRPESQQQGNPKSVHRNPRGRPPGRPRKNPPAQMFIGTPHQDREPWIPGSGSQASPDAYWHRSVQGSRESSQVPHGHIPYGMPGMTPGHDGIPVDPYAHTKKTRAKPIRNADGILIRKDGRPDKRSQSSAMNLRRRNESREQKDGASEGAPTPPAMRQSDAMQRPPETPSPTEYARPADLTDSVARKHQHNIQKIFPEGIKEATKDGDLTRKAFGDGGDHTAHSRAHDQHHHHTQEGGVQSSTPQVKAEPTESRDVIPDSQDPADDIEMVEESNADRSPSQPESVDVHEQLQESARAQATPIEQRGAVSNEAPTQASSETLAST